MTVSHAYHVVSGTNVSFCGILSPVQALYLSDLDLEDELPAWICWECLEEVARLCDNE